MDSTADTHDLERNVLQAYRTRIAKLVLPDEGGCDRRDAMVLIDCDVFSADNDHENNGSTEAEGPCFTIDSSDIPLGPLVFYSDEHGKSCVARARDLLLDERIVMRQGALDHLQAVASVDGMMSQHTRYLIDRNRREVQLEQKWRRASIKIADAIDEDWMFNLAGVHQAVGKELEDFGQEYVDAVLRPSVAAMDRCSPSILCISLNQNEIKAFHEGLLESGGSIDFVCDEYLKTLGHIPFGGEYGLGKTLQAHTTVQATSDQLVDWATQVGTPFARYHACEAILTNKLHLSTEQRDLISTWFWEIIIPSTDLGQVSEEHATWKLADCLARYFVHYLEVRLPSDNGEVVSAIAWRLTSKLVTIWKTAELSASSFADQTQTKLGTTAGGVWELVGPPMLPSMLLWMTIFEPSPWAVSVLSAVAREDDMRWLRTGVGPGTTDERVAALTKIAILSANLHLGKTAYRFTEDFRKTLCWAFVIEPDETKRNFARMLTEGIDWSQPDSLSKALESLNNQDPTTQIWYCHAIRQRMATDLLSGDEVWALVSESSWRSTTWLCVDLGAAQALGSALVDFAARRNPEWAPQLQHLFVEIAEERSESEGDRLAFFALLLQACSVLNTSSGLERLLGGRYGHHYRSLASDAKQNVEQVLPHAGGWAAGRLRALLVGML